MGKQFYNDLYHDVNAVDAVIGHCPRSIRVPRYMGDVRGNLFLLLLLFCSTSRAVLKMFTRLFWIKASESLKKTFSRRYSCIHKEEKWINGDKKSSRLLENA